MTYQEFLTYIGSNDTPLARQYYDSNAPGSIRYPSSGQMPIGSEMFAGVEPGAQAPTALGPMMRSNLGFNNTDQTPYVSHSPYVTPAPTSVMTQPTSTIEEIDSMTYGGSGADPALVSDYDVTGQEGLLDSADETKAGDGNYYGYAMLGNTAGNMINTHDKELVDTPMGNKGSYSGMMKGATKGASTGATAGGMIGGPAGAGWGAVIGGTLGLLGGAQGYFDTRTPPQTKTQTVQPVRGGGFGGQATSLFG